MQLNGYFLLGTSRMSITIKIDNKKIRFNVWAMFLKHKRNGSGTIMLNWIK